MCVYGCLNSPTISERRSIGSTYVYDKLTDGQQINLLFAAVRMYVCMYVWIDVYVAPRVTKTPNHQQAGRPPQ